MLERGNDCPAAVLSSPTSIASRPAVVAVFLHVDVVFVVAGVLLFEHVVRD